MTPASPNCSGPLQLLGAAVILLVLARHRERSAVLVALAALLAFVVADDLLRLHETHGRWCARRFGFPEVLGAPPETLGEIMLFLGAGLPLGVSVLWTLVRSDGPARTIALKVAFFAVAWHLWPPLVALRT